MLPRSKESYRYRDNQCLPVCVDTRDDIDDGVCLYSAPRQRNGNKRSQPASDATIGEFRINKTPTEIMRGNLVNCQLSQNSLKAKQATGSCDLQPRGSMNSSPADGTPSAKFQDQVSLFSFKAAYPLHAHKPAVRHLHRKIVSAFFKSNYDPKKKQSVWQEKTEHEKSLGQPILSRSVACHGIFQESHPRDAVPADMPSMASVDNGIKSTYLRRRLTPEVMSLSDLQARFHSKCHLHQELDQLVKARLVASTHSVPVATLRDPIGAPLSPFVEDDDEDSEIQSDVSSAIEITDSSARSQKLFHYLRSANKSLILSNLQVQKNDSCHFADVESIVDRSDEAGILDGSEGEEKDSFVARGSKLRHDITRGCTETLAEGSNPLPILLGEFDESQTKEVNHCATSIIVDGLVKTVTPEEAPSTMDLLGAIPNEDEENEDWVSFGAFHETPMANAMAHDGCNDPAPCKLANESRSEEKTKVPLLSNQTDMNVIIDLSGVSTDFKESIVYINSGDASELTDYDFPDVSKASHPVDQETQQRLTTSDIIRLSRNRLIEKKRLRQVNRAQPHLQEEGLQYVDSPKSKADVSKADAPPSLFNRPSSTPFQNKAQDGSIPGITMAPRSVLRRSSFCGSNQSDTLPFATRGKTDSTRENQIVIDSPLSAPPISQGKKDAPVVLTDASSMNPVGPTCVSSDEEDDDDPLSRLQCLTRLAI